MYKMKPPAVYVHESVIGDAECEARRDRVLAATGVRDYQVVADNDIPSMLKQPQWVRLAGAAGARDELHDPVLYFNTFSFGNDFEARRDRIVAATGCDPQVVSPDLLGYEHFTWFNSGQDADDIKPRMDHVCRPAWRLHTGRGCAHQCFYCGLAGFIVAGLNMTEYLQRLDRLVDANPWEPTYLLDDVADVLALEPELGVFGDIAEYFGRKDDRYLIIHTKSANVDFLEQLDHRGHTIMTWSLSGTTQSQQLEPITGSTTERIEAAAKCQQWGYPVRFKFKPIVPVRDWRDEARQMIRTVFNRTSPDNLSLTMLMWMEFSALEQIVDLDLLDPEFVDAARRAANEETDEPKMRPFPHEMRKKVYEFFIDEIRAIDRDVPLTICTESLTMWKDLGPKLGLRPDNYTCGCGPQSTPGLTQLTVSPWKVARPVDAWR